jgi:phage baseplate assembly protein W
MAGRDDPPHFLGRGWAFPPAFDGGGVAMVDDEADIRQSLQILFGTLPGERPLAPDFGLDLSALLFEPLSTTLRTLLEDRIRTTLLVHEARIRVLALTVDDGQARDGLLHIRLDYAVRSTNSRFNLVFPFYLGDANELRETRAPATPAAAAPPGGPAMPEAG